MWLGYRWRNDDNRRSTWVELMGRQLKWWFFVVLNIYVLVVLYINCGFDALMCALTCQLLTNMILEIENEKRR